jgi:hypothetical protein
MSFFVTAIAYYPEDKEKNYDKPYKRTQTFGHFPIVEDAKRIPMCICNECEYGKPKPKPNKKHE